ncbi:synaptic vesicle glycoprotein 2C-like isoform X2 [Choristoneura fumiferana]|uniref:synaptic vesicle glycoprotein 2C-like isoform X2 n=1 Tax=Choristoneura fumiferana TaxID=7141 RepID=UPI003D158BB2
MPTFEEAYELTGHGKFNNLALLTCGFILLYVTTECLGAGYMLNGAECDLNISVTERGFVAAATFIGVVSTAIFWGYLADTYGRRRVMLPAILGTITISICSSLSVSFWNMFILRLLTGCLVSASIATVYAFLGELHTASHRASALAYGSAFIACSLFIMPGMAWLILPGTWSLHVSGRLSIVPWRVFMWSWCFWGALGALGLSILPESPRYLLATKGPNAVLPVLAKMYAWNYKKKAEDFPVTEIAAAQHTRPSFKESLGKLKYMIRPPLLRCVLISHTCIFLLFMQTNAFYVWMPHIVNELLSSNVTTSMCNIMDMKYANKPEKPETHKCEDPVIDSRMYPISMFMGILTAIIYVYIGFVIDRWGRKRVYCSLVMFCSMLTLFSGIVPHAYVSIAMFIPGLCGGAATSVLATLAVEVFPTSLSRSLRTRRTGRAESQYTPGLHHDRGSEN